MVTLSSRRERIDQLAALLDGDLADHQVRAEVRRLATLAATVTTEVERPTLAADERDRIRTRVMAAVHTDLQAAEVERRAPRRAARSTRAAVATSVASVLIGTGGVAVAAQEALPGDALYGIKQATESVRVAAAGDLLTQGRIELALAVERLEEVTTAVDRGDVRGDALVDTLARMDQRSITGTDTLARVAEREDDPALLAEIATFTERQADGLVDVFGRLPVDVRPHAEDSLATLRAIRERYLTGAFAEADVSSAELAGAVDELLRSSPLPAAPTEDPAPAPTEDAADHAPDATPQPSGSDTTVPTSPLPSLPLPTDRPEGAPEERRRIVPPLPGPLDEVGKGLDDTVGGVLDGTGKLIEDTTGAVDDVLDGVGGVVDGVVDGVGGLLDGVGGLVGGLLGGEGVAD